jgi:DNA-binding PadR family transcriptional regulator
MDIIILKRLRTDNLLSGYDIIKYLHRKFHILPSPGTVYSILYALERQKLIEGNMSQEKRLYRLTNQGEKLLNQIGSTKNHIQAYISYIFSET